MDVSQLDSKAAPWLKLLTSISYLGIQEELPIPQIAVIGDQSSGKSSLLESISKIPFPKGSGLVTKCPTRITMTRITNTQKLQSQSQSQSQSQERKEIEGQEKQWKAIVTLPKRLKDYENNNNFNRPIYDPNELSKILSLASDIVSDNSPGIFSFDPINVLVEATTIPNLSIIDLPGIIRTTTVGQNKEIINEINELLSHYMKQPETIILAVIPSNQDIATIDVLERAYHYDPNGIRTIGVLTKPDLVDEGSETEILSIMNNKRKPLSLGYYIVKNRNQLELNQNLSVEESIKHELDYFINHSVWKTIDINRVGIKSLCEKLSDIIISRAIERGPYIKWHLEQKNKQITETLKTLGTEISASDSEKRKLIIRLISRFSQTLRQIVVGDYRDEILKDNTELRIKFHVNEILKNLQESIKLEIPNLDTQEYEERLRVGISEMRGR